MIVWPNVWTAEPTSHDYRMMHEAREVSKGVKYGANVWLRLYPMGRDERYPVPPLCDMYPHVPECSGDELSKRRRDRVRGRQKRRGGGGAGGGGRNTHRHSHSSHAAANSNSSSMSLSLPPYACTRHRDFRANCIRGGGVGCPFREIRSLLECKALCEEYEGQCYTFVHNKYAECYLRAEHAGAGVADHPRHRTVSCRRNANW